MSQIEKQSDNQGETLTSVTAALLKSGVASVGILAAAALGESLPPSLSLASVVAVNLSTVLLETRKKRVTTFYERFLAKVRTQPKDVQDHIIARLQTEAGSGIFETAWQQAYETVEEEKLEYIAAYLKNTLSSSALEEFQTHWLLQIIDELDPVQIIILKSYSEYTKKFTPISPVFLMEHETHTQRQHPEVFAHAAPPKEPVYRSNIQTTDLTLEEANKHRHEDFEANYDTWRKEKYPHLWQEYKINIERHAIHQSRLQALVERGLIGAVTHDVGVQMLVTPLGMALLKVIDEAPHDKWGEGEQIHAVEALRRGHPSAHPDEHR